MKKKDDCPYVLGHVSNILVCDGHTHTKEKRYGDYCFGSPESHTNDERSLKMELVEEVKTIGLFPPPKGILIRSISRAAITNLKL